MKSLPQRAALAASASRGTFVRFRREACQSSYCDCIPVQSSGPVPMASDSRNAISAEIPALPFRIRDRLARVTRKCFAAVVTDKSPRYSRSTSPGCGGLCMRIVNSSMVVVIVNQHGVFSFERKGEAPVPAYRHRPMVLQFAAQGMETPAGSVHIFRRACVVECEKLLAQSFGVSRLDFGSRPRQEKPLDSLMTEASDHPYSV